jgi:hypothetical protein
MPLTKTTAGRKAGGPWRPGGGRGSNNPLVEWLKARGYWVMPSYQQQPETGSVAPPPLPLTHVFLDGGKASVPDASRSAFHAKYCEALLSGYDQCVVERVVKDRFQMFMDVDVKLKEDGERGSRINAIIDVIARVMARHLPRSTAWIALRSQENDENSKAKEGAHIVWQGEGARVTKADAVRLREACVRECRQCQERALSEEVIDWSDVIDAAVYRNNGLRMILSEKGNEKDARGIRIRSKYEPAFVLHPNTQQLVAVPREEYVCDLVTWVERFSVYVPSPPPCVIVHKKKKKRTREDGQEEVEEEEEEEEEEDVVTVYDNIHNAADVSGHMAQEADELRAHLPPPYASARFTSIRESGGSTSPGFAVFTDCRHCLNYGKAHRSNHTYLSIDSQGVFQCCFCTCDTVEGRKYGRCSDVKVRLCARPPPLFARAVQALAQTKEADRNKETHAKTQHVDTGASLIAGLLDRVEQRFSGVAAAPDRSNDNHKNKKKKKKIL